MIISSGHYIMPYYSQRITCKEWKQALLNEEDRVYFRGHCVGLVAKKLGGGVVEVTKNIKELKELGLIG
jgi:hypothetical protein